MLRVWAKWYKAFNTGRISVLGSAMWGCGCGETDRQKLNNLISSPLFTSPPPSSLSRLLSFPHVCLLAISRLVHPRLSLRPPHSFSRPIFSQFLALVSYLNPPCPLLPYIPHPLSPFLLPVSSHSYFSVWSNFLISKSIQNMNTVGKHESNTLTGNIEILIVRCTKTHS